MRSSPATVLRYQPTRTLDRCPAYHAALQVRVDGDPVFLGRKASGLDVYFADDRALHYDLEGRLLRVATPNVHWRRGLSRQVIEMRKRRRDEGGGFEKRFLAENERNRLLEESAGRMQSVLNGLLDEPLRCDCARPSVERALQDVGIIVKRAAAFDPVTAREDYRRFRSLYGEIPVLPPDQYGSLVLAATEGCAYKQCTFCGFYRGEKFRVKSPDDFRRHIQDAMDYHGAGLAGRRGIFLGQANALAAPWSRRHDILRAVAETFRLPAEDHRRPNPRWWLGSRERFTEVSSFIDAFTGVRMLADEFACLRRLHLRRVFLGVETGDEALLKWLNKPATPETILATARAAKAGGVQIGVIVLIGAGGERSFESHIDKTVRLLRQMPLGRGDYVYLSPLVDVPGTSYAEEAAAAGIRPLTPARMAEQERRIRSAIKFERTGSGPYVARYDISHFVY